MTEQSYPVVVVCPECTAIYTPDVAGVNANLARDNDRLREATTELLRVLDRFDNAPVSASDAIETLRARLASDEAER